MRKSFPLRVDGVAGRNYFDVFKMANSPVKGEEETRIWFGAIRFTQQLRAEAGQIAIEIQAWADREQVRAIADTSDWSSFQKARFVGEIAEALKSSRSAASESKPVAQVYVLSSRSVLNPSELNFKDPRKFAIIDP